jgi:translation initiation factor RLI1
MSPVPLIDFQNVTIQRGDRIVMDSVTLSIAQGEHIAILGPNGSGKSTLIKVISRELYPRLKSEPWSLCILAATQNCPFSGTPDRLSPSGNSSPSRDALSFALLMPGAQFGIGWQHVQR